MELNEQTKELMGAMLSILVHKMLADDEISLPESERDIEKANRYYTLMISSIDSLYDLIAPEIREVLESLKKEIKEM